MKPWTYKGVVVLPADRNTSGIRWYARTDSGRILADCKASMRKMITANRRSR